jgi:hypothetical protein
MEAAALEEGAKAAVAPAAAAAKRVAEARAEPRISWKRVQGNKLHQEMGRLYFNSFAHRTSRKRTGSREMLLYLNTRL